MTTLMIDKETREYQDQTAQIRFRQNLIHGIGAAMVFGFATGVFGVLFRLTGLVPGGAVTTGAATGAAVLSGTTMALAWVGIAAAVLIGFGCLYASSRLSSELTRIEQDHHANQIAKGINGRAPEIEIQKPIALPAQDHAPEMVAANDSIMNAAQPTVSGVQLQDKVVPIDSLKARA